MRWQSLLVASILAVGALSCASTSGKLDLLRTRLLESQQGELKRNPEPADPTFLIGVSSHTIRSALGAPGRCKARGLPFGAPDSPLLPAEACYLYTFDLQGIGPAYALRLSFDRSARCSEAVWLILTM